MAQLLNLERMRNDNAFIPRLAAAGFDQLLVSEANKRSTHQQILRRYNEAYVNGGHVPAMDKAGLFQYMADRQAAGLLGNLHFELDVGEEMPAPISRAAAPTIHREGNNIVMDTPTANLPAGAPNTTVVVYINLIQKVSAARDLSSAAQRVVNAASWGLVGDETIQVGLVVDGVHSWLASLTLNA